MSKIITVLSLVCSLYVMTSCQKTNEIELRHQEYVATIGSPITKTSVDSSGKVTWKETDVIGIFGTAAETPVKAVIKTISADGKTAVFTPESDVEDPVGAIYPYDSTAIRKEGVIKVIIKSEQSGSFEDANISASKVADGNVLSFKNVTSVFKFKVSDADVKSIKLKASGISGTLGITLGNAISSEMIGQTTNEVEVPNIVPGTEYYVAIPAKSYDEIKYEWYAEDGEVISTATRSNTIAISSNVMYTWGNLREHQDVVAFSDENFKSYCVEHFDTDGDGEISKVEALSVTEIEVDTEIVGSLDGIEDFTNLKSLTCTLLSSLAYKKMDRNISPNLFHYSDDDGNEIFHNKDGEEIKSKLKSLDVSKNTSLTYLNCSANQLQSLDISKNVALEDLDCGSNILTKLDISQNTALICLDCHANKLTELDVSHNGALMVLECCLNGLKSLDVNQNSALTQLDCCLNELTCLDVSENTALALLYCFTNPLKSLDVSQNTALTELLCHYNQLTTLDVSNNANLMTLGCMCNQLANLDVSKNIALTFLNCSANELTNLDVSQNTALTELYCYYNQLTGLDISKNTSLTKLDCSNNDIPYIYVWKGFDKYDDSNFTKDESAVYVEIGNSIGNVEDYNVVDPWSVE